MGNESEIQADIESIKARFSETKALYREVCSLLFFRHGITPTTSKLYQYVRKGSMSAPADALNKFWSELRSRAQVKIDHPDLPEALRIATADAVQTLWCQATELARTELASLRVEAQAESAKALIDLAAEQERASALEVHANGLHMQLEDLAGQLLAHNAEIEAERRKHAAATARAQALQGQVSELQAQQEQIWADFTAELAKSRTAIEAANERAAGAERWALREIEAERTRRAAAEKQLEGVRTKLADAERRCHAKALEFVAENARICADLDTTRALVKTLTVADDTKGEELLEARRQATQFQAEAHTLRSLLAQFKPAPAPITRSRRGGGGANPTKSG